MAARTTARPAPSTTPPAAPPGGPLPDVPTLTAAARKTIASSGAGKAAALQQLTRELTEACASLTGDIAYRETQHEPALRESTEAYETNLRAIATAEAHVKQLEALLKVVATAQAQASDVEFDDEVRAVGMRVRALRDAAIAQRTQYEKHARAIKAILQAHVEVFDALRDFGFHVDGPVRDGLRDNAWRAAMRQACLGDETVIEALHIIGGPPLADAVQLPSSTQLEAHWGTADGQVRESLEERAAREQAVRDSLPPTRAMGVYDADGKRVMGPRNPTFEESRDVVHDPRYL